MQIKRSAPQASAGSRSPAAPQRVTSGELLGSAGMLIILHQGREYLLRVTQNGRLILTA